MEWDHGYLQERRASIWSGPNPCRSFHRRGLVESAEMLDDLSDGPTQEGDCWIIRCSAQTVTVAVRVRSRTTGWSRWTTATGTRQAPRRQIILTCRAVQHPIRQRGEPWGASDPERPAKYQADHPAWKLFVRQRVSETATGEKGLPGTRLIPRALHCAQCPAQSLGSDRGATPPPPPHLPSARSPSETQNSRGLLYRLRAAPSVRLSRLTEPAGSDDHQR